MFAKALSKAFGFTKPIIISTRTEGGRVVSNCAAYIAVNPDGWIITAGHVFDSFTQYQRDQKKAEEAEKAGLPKDPELLVNHSFWWGQDGVSMESAYVDRMVDIAVVKLRGFNPKSVPEYPVFRDPDTLRPGTSVCKLGFPFKEVSTEFDESRRSFRITQGLPLPFFPMDGIHTRNVSNGVSPENHEILYVETSTPGFKGQSGGPMVDTDGMIYAMQVQTVTLPLDFHPVVEYGGQKTVENQVLNLGLGVHVRTIRKILDEKGVPYIAEGRGSQGERYVIDRSRLCGIRIFLRIPQ